jgi:hypothetical protein
MNPPDDRSPPRKRHLKNYVEYRGGEIGISRFSAPASSKKLGAFPLIAFSATADQYAPCFRGLSTAIYNILWLSFRAIARCGQLCISVEGGFFSASGLRIRGRWLENAAAVTL